MFGFSVYLNNELTSDIHNYLLTMRNAGFTSVFTSLSLPDDEDQVLKRLATLTNWCRDLDLTIVADVDQDNLSKIGIDLANLEQVKDLNVTGLRIDAGINMGLVAKLSQQMLIALNASTLSTNDLLTLREEYANFDNLEAWSNFYPRPETGLGTKWFVNKNEMFKKAGMKVMAFIPGDGEKRGPVFAGLPTLEKHRYINPLAAAIDLQKVNVDRIYVGDKSLAAATLDQFKSYFTENMILLHVKKAPQELLSRVWHQRPDVARDVVRLEEGRTLNLFDVEPSEMLERKVGAITVDNKNYLPYVGELEVCKRDLPANGKINVIGQVTNEDLALLKFIQGSQAVKFAQI